MSNSSAPGTSPSAIPQTSPANSSPLKPNPNPEPEAAPGSAPSSRSELASSNTTNASSIRRSSATSPPIDPSKLNNTPAPLPIAIPSSGSGSGFGSGSDSTTGTGTGPGGLTSPPLRDANTDPISGSTSAYLDTGAPHEPSSHPTIAETGSLSLSSSKSPGSGSSFDQGQGQGPGPKSGQLQRKEKKTGEGIIKLGSFGGEGLVAKPPTGLHIGDDEAVE